jgi:hypothetical protein
MLLVSKWHVDAPSARRREKSSSRAIARAKNKLERFAHMRTRSSNAAPHRRNIALVLTGANTERKGSAE